MLIHSKKEAVNKKEKSTVFNVYSSTEYRIITEYLSEKGVRWSSGRPLKEFNALHAAIIPFHLLVEHRSHGNFALHGSGEHRNAINLRSKQVEMS